MIANKRSSPSKSVRKAISGSQKEQICNYARANPAASNQMILAWARATFNRPDFPQSTLSTVLSKNGIITQKSGSRGRPPSRRTLARSQDEGLRTEEERDLSVVSQRTGVLVKELQTLAEGRYRDRLSVYADIELRLLEDVYDMVRLGQTITQTQLREKTYALLLQKRATYQRKYLCQFLEGITAKYFLLDNVVRHLKGQVTYRDMLDKLATKFPALRFAPLPYEIEPTTPEADYMHVHVQDCDQMAELKTQFLNEELGFDPSLMTATVHTDFVSMDQLMVSDFTHYYSIDETKVGYRY